MSRKVIPRNSIYSLEFASNKMYWLFVSVTTVNEQDCNTLF